MHFQKIKYVLVYANKLRPEVLRRYDLFENIALHCKMTRIMQSSEREEHTNKHNKTQTSIIKDQKRRKKRKCAVKRGINCKVERE